MDIGGWLRSLGLEQYEAVFRDNAINETVLPNITAEDLKDLGIGIVGHRRMLLNAIAALRNETDLKTASPAAAAAVNAMRQDTAERRQVTVMFSDLVGSTALSARLDPEDLREVLSVYRKCVAETVRRHGGFLAKYLGDGVLVYFGYPEAHEDDAERAVRTGLELVVAVSALKSPVALQIRIGVATGLVVVGDLVGSGASQEHGIVGETPNLAARLQEIAGPNSVVIADGTRKLLGNLFELQDLGPQTLKGIAGPVAAFVALRPSSVASRFEALHAGGFTELVGREEELDLLLRRWSRAKTGEGQVVLVSGEAGIGKSRLTAALLERLAGEPYIRLRYFCSPQHTDSALYPVSGQMERAARFAHDDTPQGKLDKLDALLTRSSTPAQDAALFAEMLSVPNDGRYPLLEMTPEQRRQRTLQALIAQTEALARSNPVLMIFEDAHWTDPTSLELFGRAVDRIASLNVLLIATFRPEFEPPWIGRSHVTALTINRLGQRDIDTMIDRVVGDKLLPTSIRQDIIERTDGIPLFVEEMTKAVLEAGSEGAAQHTAALVQSSALAVPASLHASLMARLDRLGPAKEVAQIGSVIGREFSHTLLDAVVGKSEAELNSALQRLIGAGLLFRQGVPPHAIYLFKHALVQDAAYGTLLREPRRALHARIAEILESQFADIAERQPELLARHFTEAGQIETAAGHWGKAGQRSLARSALVEATNQLPRALSQLASLPRTAALRREEIRLQVALINSLMHVKGYASPETKAATEKARLLIEQAEALGEPPDDPLMLFSVLYGLWGARYNAFDGAAVCELARQFLARAQKLGATVPLMMGHRLMGSSLLLTGDIAASRAHFDQAFAFYDPVTHRPLATRFGQDIGVSILMSRSYAVWLLGYPETALADAEQAIKNAREIGHAPTLMIALVNMTYILCGNYAAASLLLKELVALADEKGAHWWKALGTSLQGHLFAMTGEASNAVRAINGTIDAWRSMGSTVFVPLSLLYLAKAYAELGLLEDAGRCIDEAMAAVEKTDERWFEAEIHHMAGSVALMSTRGDVANVEAHFERALAISRKQGARSLELRAAMSMARFWRDQGRRSEARDLLASVYGWFTEGFDTIDLKNAKVLLDALA